MSQELLSDALWDEIRPCLPAVERKATGRPAVDDRTVVKVILLVLRTGLSWRQAPLEFGCSEKTCRRRLKAWTASGAWDAVLRRLQTKLRAAGKLDLTRTLIDASHVKAPCGGENAGLARSIAAAVAASSTSPQTGKARRLPR